MIIKNPIIIGAGGGELPTLFTPTISLNQTSNVLKIADDNGAFASYNVYIDDTLVGVYASKSIDLTAFTPTDVDKTVKVEAIGEFFNPSSMSNIITWQFLPDTEGLAYTLNEDGLGYTVSGIGTATGVTDLVIPSEHEGLPVTAIGESAFSTVRTIRNVVVKDGVTMIGNSAFNDCRNIETVELANSVKIVGEFAFYMAGALRYFIANGVEEICMWSMSFGGTENFTLELNSLKNIAIYGFTGCAALVGTLILPSTVETIGDHAFNNISQLTEVIFSGTPRSIGSIFGGHTVISTLKCPWAEGQVLGAPWGATNATIIYNYQGE